jgi:uroporphyrinogen III methyltransferase/synthase
VFTSRNTVRRVFARLHDSRAFGKARVACIGDGTAAALAAHGIVADLVPDTFVSEALAAAFPRAARKGERLLLPRAAVGRDLLPARLEALGYDVDLVEAYRTVRPELAPELVTQARGVDAVVFASASAAVGWAEVMGDPDPGGVTPTPPVACCIGPVTAAAARAAGIDVTIESKERSIPGLVQALSDYAVTHGKVRY